MMYLRTAALVLLTLTLTLTTEPTTGQAQSRQQAVEAMRTATEYFHGQVAIHGGYVYHYSLDLKQRLGEGAATDDQIWVQPPGTPTVGMAFLAAHTATKDKIYLEAATDAAIALIYGQLKSGGWQNLVDFNPNSKQVSQYRNGKGGRKNNSSFDDGQSQSAMLFLVQMDKTLKFQDATIHEATLTALDALLLAQFPNGAFPQVWSGPVESQRIRKASYPTYDWTSEGRIKNYWDMYTLNDNVTGYIADVLIEAHQTYHDKRYLTALKKLGDFLLLAQMPEPQPGWAQQYNYDMNPIWARKFEPPAIASDETQEVIVTLIKIAELTNDHMYLKPIPSAVAWLKRSMLREGGFARYYELKTNRPLYMSRERDKYSLTYDDSNLPSHYGWKTPSRLDDLSKRYARLRTGKQHFQFRSIGDVKLDAKQAIETLGADGRWISIFRGQRLIGQFKPPLGTKFLSSQVFSDNMNALSEYVSAKK